MNLDLAVYAERDRDDTLTFGALMYSDKDFSIRGQLGRSLADCNHVFHQGRGDLTSDAREAWPSLVILEHGNLQRVARPDAVIRGNRGGAAGIAVVPPVRLPCRHTGTAMVIEASHSIQYPRNSRDFNDLG